MLNPDGIHNRVSFLTCFCRLHSTTLVGQGLTEWRKATSGQQQNSINYILLQDRKKNAPDHYCEATLQLLYIYIPCDPSTDAARNMLHLCHLKLWRPKEQGRQNEFNNSTSTGGTAQRQFY
jgi:hypothetical protein